MVVRTNLISSATNVKIESSLQGLGAYMYKALRDAT